jgi:DNA-binding MarR family transcriptional regulator
MSGNAGNAGVRAAFGHESPPPMRRRLVTARVWTLMTSLRLSADLVYRRQNGLAELDRRLLMELHAAGRSGATPLSLNAVLGHDKAQVSRALKRLEAAGSIRRTRLRGPVALTAAGERLTLAMVATAERRNEALTEGVERAQVDAFLTMVRTLTERAVTLLAQEKATAGDSSADPKPPGGGAVGSGRFIAGTLMTLLVYLQRSASLAYKRLTGLSSFDWQVLSQVAEHVPLPLATLIMMLGRDKGQAGRTVKRLEELGLVRRIRAAGRRAVQLEPTGEGRTIYARMAEDALRRNAFLIDGVGRDDMADFLTTLDRLTANADRLLTTAKQG